jgi:hypothetical protein
VRGEWASTVDLDSAGMRVRHNKDVPHSASHRSKCRGNEDLVRSGQTIWLTLQVTSNLADPLRPRSIRLALEVVSASSDPGMPLSRTEVTPSYGPGGRCLSGSAEAHPRLWDR